MIWVLVLCGVIWSVGLAFGVGLARRLTVVGAVWIAAFVLFRIPFDLASDHARLWILVTVVAVVVAVYTSVLKRLKQMVKVPDRPSAPPVEPRAMNVFSRIGLRPAWCRPVPRPVWPPLCRAFWGR